MDTSGGDLTWTSVSGRPRATLHGVSCATSECKVMRVLETRSYEISGSKVVCDLGIQVAHEASGYIEYACGVEVELGQTWHDVVCGAKHLVNSWSLNLVENNHAYWACEHAYFWAGAVRDVMVLVPRWLGRLTRGSWNLKGYVPLSFHGKLSLWFFKWAFFRAWGEELFFDFFVF